MKSARLLVEALLAMALYYPLLVLVVAAGAEFLLAHLATSAHHHVLVESATVLLALSAVGLAGVPRFARHELFRVSGIDEIDTMTGEQFEQRLAVLFRTLGYRVSPTRATGDFGADLVLDRDGVRTVVQAKRWDSSVGIEAVYEVVGAKAHYGASEAVVVTNLLFTPAAVELADDNGVALVERDELVNLLACQASIAPRTGLFLALSQIASGIRFVLGVVRTACVAVIGLIALMAARRAYRRVVRHA
jgi:HJR/Mrr/RecB family endonuclease